jgi:hypothetical protein
MSKGFVKLMDEINGVHELALVSEESLVLSRNSQHDTGEGKDVKTPIDSNG